jgi:hypothetical protein
VRSVKTNIFFTFSLHMELHSTEIRLKCTYPNCTAVLRTNQKLQLHLQDHKFRDLGKTIPCPEPGCTMMFYAHKPSQLTRHKRIHTGKTYFDCKLCLKSFVDSTGRVFGTPLFEGSLD